ncbi:fibronectin type III domain-containing protein [Bifidobacterium callimiconis]|uniref:Fibronectin type III domain-containing protein n=1 Tax=Bifidobacterium callimiconis TaxID=2306973 RepID=A0A430FE44_9BIFI|nr:fibronectin type III domain-containing protein [Bifidobacterium callimiconis]RSX51123.1 Fibronectin type III domain-containing protein [Bifidobacterium callimiconis]
MFFNSRKRAAALASVVAAATMGAGLIVPVASAAASTEKTVDDATFAWGLNKETNWRAYAPGTFNFLSAGIVDKTSAEDSVTEGEWKQSDGNVTIEKKQSDGTYKAATWAGLKTTPDGKDLPAAYSATGESSGNRVKLSHGTGTIDAENDNAEISWTGAFTVVYYSGLNQWYAKDLKLTVADGKGTVTATLGGWGTDMNDTSKFSVLTERQNVEIATLSNVDVKDDGTIVTPDFNEIDVDGQGTVAKSWPKAFVDFVSQTGSGAYWYASGGSGDARKTPAEITVAYTAKAVEPEATAPAAPAKPTATVAGTMADPYQVKVEWKAPSDGGSAITGYTVTLTPSTGDPITQDVAADATSAMFGKLTAPAVSYTASVVAKNEVGASAASPASAAVTPNADPTSTPAITVTPTTHIDPSKETTFTVKGTGFTGGAAFYGAYVVVADTDVWNAGQNPSSAKDFVKAAWIKAADIKNGEFTTTVTIPADTFQYGKNYVVGTTAAHGLSLTDRRLDTAKPIALKAQAQVPDAPAKPTASVPAAGSVKVEWKAPSDGGSAITGYTVTLTPSTGAPITRDVAADATSATFDGLTAKGVSYTATVVAKNEAGASAPSAASAAVTPTEATKPSAPRAVTVKQGAVHELLVSWEKPEDNGGSAITGYTVTLTPKDASAAKVKAAALTADVDANTFQHAFAKLDPATEYTASVTAKNAKGTSAAGQSDAAVAPAPIAPKLTFADADGKAITELKLDVDGKATVNAVIAGENTDDVTVAWESSDAAVVKVTAAKTGDKATVTALKSGAVTVTIKATIDGAAVSASMPVTVTAPATDGGNDSDGNGSADNGNGSTGTDNGNSDSNGSTAADNGTGSSASTNTNAANGTAASNTAKKTATLSKTGSAVLGVFGAAIVLVAGAGIALAARRRMSRD